MHTLPAVRRSSFIVQRSSFIVPVLPLAFWLLAFGFGLAPGQSFFNARSLGEVTLPADARTCGLGAPAALSYQNPGILVHLPWTSFTGSLLAACAVGTQTNQTRFIGDARPAGLHAAAPLPFETRLALGIEERFNQDFNLWSESLPDTGYRYHVIGRGGVYALRCGISRSLFGRLGIGLEYNRLLGGAHEDWQFEVANGRYVSTDTVELDYRGNGLRLGASFQTGRLALGAHYSLPHRLTARSSRRVHGVIEDSVRTYLLSIPGDIALAASFAPLEPLTAVLGLDYRPWSGLRLDTAALPGCRNSLRASLGLEYLAGRVPLRLGYSYAPWYYLARDSSAIVEHRLHLGTGVPVAGFGSLELSAEIGQRRSNGLTEYCGRLMLSLAYHEAWLERTRRWGY